MKIACTECNERLRRERGCKKPGNDYSEDVKMVFRTTSPLLHDKGDPVLRECPIGFIQRSGAHVYKWFELEKFVESGNIGPCDLPQCSRQALSVIASERHRLGEMRKKPSQGISDSAFGARARARR